jgi:metal-responsive CopG/Arc/MetJ family transcriptional regulator
MSKRISVALPQATIQAMDRMARLGERSRFNQTVQHYVVNRSTEVLRAQMVCSAGSRVACWWMTTSCPPCW